MYRGTGQRLLTAREGGDESGGWWQEQTSGHESLANKAALINPVADTSGEIPSKFACTKGTTYMHWA